MSVIDFDDLLDRFVHDPFCDLNERPKLLAALRLLATRMLYESYDDVPGVCLFAPAKWKHGQAYPTPTRLTVCIVYISPELEQMDQSQNDFTLAHEFAHVVLGHYKIAESLTTKPLDYLQQSQEKAADALVVKWGYELPEYRKVPKKKLGQ